jgi:hypothetical protein
VKQVKNRIDIRYVVLVSIISGGLGILAGGLGEIYREYGFFSLIGNNNIEPGDINRGIANLSVPEEIVKHRDWVSYEFYKEPVRWCYLNVDQNSWFATPVNNLLQLKERINSTYKEILIPVFPTVYLPINSDSLYYNTILESDIESDDKVLVIGSGTGSDAWVAWLKSQSLVYVIEINPMAVANINTTARLGNFPVKTILGDITKVDIPKDFNDFDYVLWNMPYIYPEEKGQELEERNYHDGDDGSILRSFLELLPTLLKKDGQAIILNTEAAREYIKFPNVTSKSSEAEYVVYIIKIQQ